MQEPRAKKVAEAARILGTTVAYLLGDIDDPDPTAQLKQTEKPITTENIMHDNDANMASVTLKDGNVVKAPPTPEGYSFLEKVVAMSLGVFSPALVAGLSTPAVLGSSALLTLLGAQESGDKGNAPHVQVGGGSQNSYSRINVVDVDHEHK